MLPIIKEQNFTSIDIMSMEKQTTWNCKILQFSSDWNFFSVLQFISGLNPADYPNLYIFMIHTKSLIFGSEGSMPENVKESLINFIPSRPLVVQLISEDDKIGKVYFKDEGSEHFEQHQDNNTEDVKNFSTFLEKILNGNFQACLNDLFLIEIPIRNFSLVLRFLNIFELDQEVVKRLILMAAKNGIKADFIAALDAPFENEGRILSSEAQNYLSELLAEDNSRLKESDKNAANESDEDSPDRSYTSVLLTAIEHKNSEVINYLITYWTHLIQQLPLDHQAKISSAAFETNQVDVLCDLLEITDFPFPEDYEIIISNSTFDKLQGVISTRMRFKSAIKQENFEEIDKFIDNNPNLRMAFVSESKTSMDHALQLKKFKVYFYLKSAGFQTTDSVDIGDILSEEEIEEAQSQAQQQKRMNVKEAVFDPNSPVMLLSTKSGIHNKRTGKDKAAEYRKIIRKWFEDISKIDFCSSMLEVAASCENLKIIFDFESETVKLFVFLLLKIY